MWRGTRDRQSTLSHPGTVMESRHHAVRTQRPIDIDNARDVLFWTGLWGLTDQELFDAVAAVGPSPEKVANHLGQPLSGGPSTPAKEP
jgi:hypothetical protein